MTCGGIILYPDHCELVEKIKNFKLPGSVLINRQISAAELYEKLFLCVRTEVFYCPPETGNEVKVFITDYTQDGSPIFTLVRSSGQLPLFGEITYVALKN